MYANKSVRPTLPCCCGPSPTLYTFVCKQDLDEAEQGDNMILYSCAELAVR